MRAVQSIPLPWRCNQSQLSEEEKGLCNDPFALSEVESAIVPLEFNGNPVGIVPGKDMADTNLFLGEMCFSALILTSHVDRVEHEFLLTQCWLQG